MRTTSVAVMVKFVSKVSFRMYFITAIFKVFSQQLQDTLAMTYERHPPVEGFTDTDQGRCRACTKTFELL